MAFRNSRSAYGSVSRVIHWLMALTLLGMLGFGLYIAHVMRFTLDNLWVYQIHKSIGVTMLALVIIRLVWHRISPPPAALPAPAWQNMAAKAVHVGLYVLMLAVPLTGWIASAASGIDTVIWGVTVPPIAPVSEPVQDAFFAAHAILTRLMMGLLVLHVGGALTHAGALRRMASGAEA